MPNNTEAGSDFRLGAPTSEAPSHGIIVREFSGEFDGVRINYRAIAGETYIRDQKGAAVASYFTIAYLKSGVINSAARPVAFIFNGGPGSSSMWLHMGGLGPKRVRVPSSTQNIGTPPYFVVDNNLSLLGRSDLVFIDPIGTGYSRALPGTDASKYWGLHEDAESIADLIERWITDYGRWNSPKYLIGESYGTARACLLAESLGGRYIAINGIVLLAAVLDYQNSRPRDGDGGILSYASFLPTYAATAWYHGKVSVQGRTLEEFLAEVREFARTDYAVALIANVYRLSPPVHAKIVSRLVAYTGLSQGFIENSNLRIPVKRFFKELLRTEGLAIGRLDGRYVGAENDSLSEFTESDPTFNAIRGAFASALSDHLRDLGVRVDRPYVFMSGIVEDSWKWSSPGALWSGGGYVNVVPSLGRAMRQNDKLKVLVASGYYDLATPFFGVENALSQDGLVQERIQHILYEVGHMIFLHEPSLNCLSKDIASFIAPEPDIDAVSSPGLD